MKAIIGGFRYDTDKSKMIGRASAPGLSTTDFSHWEAELYKTPRSGRFFLAGSGGPMTRWARGNDNSTWGSSGIIPLDVLEAYEWAERYLDTETVEEFFPDMFEDA